MFQDDERLYDDGVPMQCIAAAGVTAALLWLLSDKSFYVTGAALRVDGGISAE